MDEKDYNRFAETRRGFLKKASLGFGSIALASLMGDFDILAKSSLPKVGVGGVLKNTHFPPKAKRVIYLFQSGGPSQLETFDYKPT